jgi:hypothetical protein
VIDSWKDFLRKYQRPIDSLRSKINITLYGSYYPDNDKLLLTELKDLLRENGYSNTILVEDRQLPEDDPLEISQKCMLFSQINLLIFTHTGKRHGVIDELSFITSDQQMFEKIHFCIVFDQVKGRKSSIPSLSMSRIKRYAVQRREFRTTQELKTIIIKETYWLMRKWAYHYGHTPISD